MSKMLKFICKGGLLFFSVLVSYISIGQSLVLPSAVRIGTDVMMLGESALNNETQRFEVTGDIDVYKYFISADLGWSQKQIAGDGFTYENSGNYGRIGIDYNFIFSDVDDHVIFYGLRYARSFYNETFDYSMNDETYGSFDMSDKVQNGKARWLEMNVGLKTKIWKQFYLGWTGRFKFGRKSSGDGDFNSYEIPGFGLTTDKSRFGFSYYIYYRFRDKPRIMPKPEKEPVDTGEENKQESSNSF